MDVTRFDRFKKIILLLTLWGLTACNLFDNKIQGQIGNVAGAGGGDKPKLGDRIGLTSTEAEYLFVEGTRQDIKVIFTKALAHESTFTWSIEKGTDDFQVASGSVTLPKDTEFFEIPVIALNDGLYEGDETFNLAIDADEVYFATDLVVPLKISEKAANPPQLSLATSADTTTESGGAKTITVHLSQAAASLIKISLVISGSATMNSDFSMSPPSELVFSAGEISKTITVNVIDDTVTGEGLEDISVSLDKVEVGSATIDNANKSYSLLVEDNDQAASPITITGVRGGTDVTTDMFLTSGSSPVVWWTAASLTNETGFDVTIYETNGVTIRCPTVTTGIDSTNYNFSSCNLTEGQTYKISVVARISGGGTLAAQNSMVPFLVDTIAPGAFSIAGVMGGLDIVADGFLAGALQPTAVWTDANGETSYDVKILNAAGGTLNVTNCEVTGVPANVTSYTFENCNLSALVNYKIRVTAKDNSGQVTTPADFTFTVTNNQSGYLVSGITGGTGDTTMDENMDDGDAPRAHWQKALNATAYDVKIYTLTNVLKCALPGDTVNGSISEIIFDGCNLDLHEQYKLVVKAQTPQGLLEAANSPYVFRHRVGLYISGTGGSYINGQTVTICGGSGNDTCDSITPYVASSVVNYNKIRVSNNGYLVGASWTGNTPTTGNGVLSIRAGYLTVDTGSRISMTGRGYSAGLGPGAGSSGSTGNGASHGGFGGIISSGTQGAVYGDVLNPSTMGSGGGNGSSGAGGKGGGIIDIEVSNVLYLNGSVTAPAIEANGDSGALGSCPGTPAWAPCTNGGGGGSGGSIKIVADEVRGTNAKISVNSGRLTARTALSSAGAGGRLALYYRINTFGALTTLLESFGGRTDISAYAYTTTYGAAGTVYYKNTSATGGDVAGHLYVDNNNNPYVQGVETPIPLIAFDSIATAREGTLIVPSTDIYNHFSNIINFRLVVAGGLTLSGSPSNLVVGTLASPGMLEWRRLDTLDEFGEITVEKGSTLTHAKNSNVSKYKLVIDTTTLNVYGKIDVSGRGYDMGYGPGRATGTMGASYGGLGGVGSGTRNTVYGNLTTPTELGSGGSTNSTGDANLGLGGGALEINATTLNLVGDYSGGVKAAGFGVISASGLTGKSSGGSGGSILINVDHIYGKYGTIAADGGDSPSGGAGGGGRVAIKYKKDDEHGSAAAQTIWSESPATPYVELTSKGGDGTVDGAAGTIYLRKIAQDGTDPLDTEPIDPEGHLWVFNGSRIYDERVTTSLIESIPLDTIKTDTSGTVHVPTGLNVDLPTNIIDYRIVFEGEYTNPNPPNLTIASGGYVEWRKASPLVVNGTFTIASGGTLTHSKNSTTRQYVVNVMADYMVLQGSIDAKAKGYGKSSGPGAPGSKNWGAAHAGTGADDNTVKTGSGTPYAITDVKDPKELGSGGYCANGGGAIWLQIAETLTLSGNLDASSPDVNSVCPADSASTGGAGSGGSIYIKAKEIVSAKVIGTSPIINANGGGGKSVGCGMGCLITGMGGSGGRIAIDTVKDSVTPGGLIQAIQDKNIMAIGGRNTTDHLYGAAAGTIYIKRIKDSTDTPYAKDESLYLDNDNLIYYDRIETPIPEGLAFDEIVTKNNATLVVTSGQSFNLNPSVLEARLVVAGIFETIDNSLTIKTGGYLQWRRNTPLALNSLVVENGGTLTHTSNFTDSQYRLEIDAINFDLQSGAVVDASSKGYQLMAGPGKAADSLKGGAYGGNARSALAYGSLTSPYDLGSGGGGASGGGNIQIRVSGSATIAGQIKANGGNNTVTSGAGSGGTVVIDSNNLSLASGYLIEAKGGTSSAQESGAGGRIAIKYNAYTAGGGGPVDIATAALSSNVLASGGTGSSTSYGAAGTIYYIDKDQAGAKGHLVVRNGTNPYAENATTPLPDEANYDSVYVDPNGSLEVRLGESVTLPSHTLNYRLILGGNVNFPDASDSLTVASGGVLEVRRGAVVDDFSDITVQDGGTLTHTANNDLKTYWLEILTSGNFTLDSGGNIDVNGKGYAGGYGPSPGCSNTGYSETSKSGGSYGGFGNLGTLTVCDRSTYGSIKNPLDLGSGGGSDSTGSLTPLLGGFGGGLVKLNILGTLTLNGDVSANGLQGTCTSATRCSGSGAGGTVNITTATLAGTTGSVTANGGRTTSGSYESAAGGGGRVAISVTGVDSYGGTLFGLPTEARSGIAASNYPGAAGTIWRKISTDTNGRLFVSNFDTPYIQSGTVTEFFITEAFDSIAIGTNAAEAAATGIGVRKGSIFQFMTSDLNFPLVAVGSPRFPGATGAHLGNLNVKSGGIFEAYGDQAFTFDSVVVDSGGLVTHAKNQSSLINVLKITAQNLTVNFGGLIDVSEKGYKSEAGPGRGKNAWSSGGSGGSFGGLGGGGVTGVAPVGETYGSTDISIFTIGSGGGNGEWTCFGGAGGGGILLNVGTLTMNNGGIIRANGQDGVNSSGGFSCKSGGGGSGGAIKILANTIQGTGGQIYARGGGIATEPSNDSQSDGGGGGGGRIYVSYSDNFHSVPDILSWTFVDGGGAENVDRAGSPGTSTVVDTVP